MSNTYTYTYRPDRQEYITNNSYVFKTEAAAAAYCEMWNRHGTALEPLSEMPFTLSRDEYEAACDRFGYTPRPDTECDSYGVKYGEFTPWLDANGKPAGYTPEYALEMSLANRRRLAMDEERARQPRRPRPSRYPNGRQLDCGHIIYDGEVMNTSRGTSCFDCYDRMSD